MLMNILGFALGAGAVVAGVYFLSKRAWADIQDHDFAEIDFGSPFEDEMTSFVAELNRQHKKDAA